MSLSYSYTTFEFSLSTDVAFCEFLFNYVVKISRHSVQKTCQLERCQVTILINTEINTEENAGICPECYQLTVKNHIEITIAFLAFYKKSQMIISFMAYC